jgi:hypothetical protein
MIQKLVWNGEKIIGGQPYRLLCEMGKKNTGVGFVNYYMEWEKKYRGCVPVKCYMEWAKKLQVGGLVGYHVKWGKKIVRFVVAPRPAKYNLPPLTFTFIF